MLKQYSLILILCVLVAACGKKADPVKPANTNDSTKNNNTNDSTKNNNDSTSNASSFAFIINGVHDFAMEKAAKNILPLSITRTKGDQEKVTLSVTGLPFTITGAFDAPSGTPDFTSNLTFTTKDAPVGTYKVTITGLSASNVSKSYDATITVNAPSDCGTQFVDGYVSFIRSSTPKLPYQYGGTTGHTEVISKLDNNTDVNRLYLEDDEDFAYMYFDLNCKNNTVYIPTQTSEGRTFAGSGTFTTNPLKITLNYDETHSADLGGGTYKCTVVLTY